MISKHNRCLNYTENTIFSEFAGLKTLNFWGEDPNYWSYLAIKATGGSAFEGHKWCWIIFKDLIKLSMVQKTKARNSAPRPIDTYFKIAIRGLPLITVREKSLRPSIHLYSKYARDFYKSDLAILKIFNFGHFVGHKLTKNGSHIKYLTFSWP